MLIELFNRLLCDKLQLYLTAPELPYYKQAYVKYINKRVDFRILQNAVNSNIWFDGHKYVAV